MSPIDELLERIYDHARELHRERFAATGEPLSKYSPQCRHEPLCNDRWADRRASRERESTEPEIPQEVPR